MGNKTFTRATVHCGHQGARSPCPVGILCFTALKLKCKASTKVCHYRRRNRTVGRLRCRIDKMKCLWWRPLLEGHGAVQSHTEVLEKLTKRKDVENVENVKLFTSSFNKCTSCINF